MLSYFICLFFLCFHHLHFSYVLYFQTVCEKNKISLYRNNLCMFYYYYSKERKQQKSIAISCLIFCISKCISLLLLLLYCNILIWNKTEKKTFSRFKCLWFLYWILIQFAINEREESQISQKGQIEKKKKTLMTFILNKIQCEFFVYAKKKHHMSRKYSPKIECLLYFWAMKWDAKHFFIPWWTHQ